MSMKDQVAEGLRETPTLEDLVKSYTEPTDGEPLTELLELARCVQANLGNIERDANRIPVLGIIYAQAMALARRVEAMELG